MLFRSVVYGPQARLRYPAPDDAVEVLSEDSEDPPLILYRAAPDKLPGKRSELEDWYLAHTWADDHPAHRTLERAPFLDRTGRTRMAADEARAAMASTPPDSFLSPFLQERLKNLENRAPEEPSRRSGGVQ